MFVKVPMMFLPIRLVKVSKKILLKWREGGSLFLRVVIEYEDNNYTVPKVRHGASNMSKV